MTRTVKQDPAGRTADPAALMAALEPFLWVGACDPARWPGRHLVVRIDGIAIDPGTAGGAGAGAERDQGAGNGLARATREALYGQAENAIAAAALAGWELAEHPEITMGGRISRDRETGLDVPCAECRVVLSFRPAGG